MKTLSISEMAFFIHFAVSLIVAILFFVTHLVTGFTYFKFLRRLKLKDREAWIALTDGNPMLIGHSIFTIFSRLKVMISGLDEELSVKAIRLVKTAKISLYLFGVFAVLILALKLY